MPDRADAMQVLQRVHDQSRDTYRADAMLFESPDGGTTWTPVANLIQDGGVIVGHAQVWNGSAWINFTG